MVKFQSTKVDNMGKRILFTLGFWCLNPEVIFRDLTTTCKAVILTSGTLSPMDTFSSELNTRFEQRLEALHIIGEKQTWVGCLPVGPEGSTFLGNFKTMDSFAYQDDLSRAILAVCKVIPAGVLVFLPSYSFLDKLLTRMQAIGVHDEISKQKKIYKEPRQGAPADFEKLMQNYYRTIRDCAGRLSGGLDGALLFAVYRGKISEGLDLKDDNCRAVIPVGIPYPAFKDPKVVLKREFNDRGSGRRLMSGQQWYESQAFRALNQALGRCIRHRHDWGAIVLLEQRFTSQRNVSQLSKWVRNRVRTFGEFQLAMQSLGEFVNGNMADETCSIHKENVIISSNDELQEGKACYIID
jgi:Fanconi anemia group J protein